MTTVSASVTGVRSPNPATTTASGTTGQATPPAGSGVARSTATLALSAAFVALVSYGCVLLAARLLSAGDYVDFVATQAVLTAVGVVASALVPLPLSRAVRAHRSGTPERRSAIAFATVVSVLAGLVSAAVVTGLTLGYAPLSGALVAGLAALLICAVMPVWGWLQGEARFALYAGGRAVEAGVRLAVTVAAGLLGWGLTGAVGGFAAGAAVALLVGALVARHDLAWSLRSLADRGRWAETGSIAGVVGLLATLAATDAVLLAHSDTDLRSAAGYQAMATLTKAPVYLATATALVAFPLIRTTAGVQRSAALTAAVRSFGVPALAAAVLLATVPVEMLRVALPADYVTSSRLLPALAVAGFGLGLVSVLAMLLLAAGSFGRLAVTLVGALGSIPTALAVGLQTAGPTGLATGAAVGSGVAAIVAVAAAGRVLPAGVGAFAARAVLVAGLLVTVLLLLRSQPVLWAAAVCTTVLVAVAWRTRSAGRKRPAGADNPADPTAASDLPATADLDATADLTPTADLETVSPTEPERRP